MLLSVIIPVHDGMKTLPSCLGSLRNSSYTDYESIVVDDGSTDASASFAEQWGARVIRVKERLGPAHARNEGARAARGPVLVFLDADVAVAPDTLAQFAARFTARSPPDAVMGSYDDSPRDPRLISSFKNLLHHYTHQQGRAAASSFWCGCGAIDSKVFFSHGGLDDSYSHPSIEDIELGLRMFRAGRTIVLDPKIQAKHLKIWTLWNLVKTDVLFRGIPWTELILRSRYLPDDLNLRWKQRVSAASAWLGFSLICGVLLLPLPVAGPIVGGTCAGLLALILALNNDFYAFLASRRGWGFAAAAFPLHLLYFLYSGVSLVAGVASYTGKSLNSFRTMRQKDDSNAGRCS